MKSKNERKIGGKKVRQKEEKETEWQKKDRVVRETEWRKDKIARKTE